MTQMQVLVSAAVIVAVVLAVLYVVDWLWWPGGIG